MKICTIAIPTPLGEVSRLGILLNDTDVLDVNLTWARFYQKEGRFNYQERADHKAPSSLSQLLNLSDEPLELLNQTLDLYKKLENDKSLVFKSPKLLAPLDKIATYRDFYTHEKHVAKGFEKRNEPIPQAWYEIPAYYKGQTQSFIGSGEPILWPHYTKVLDYELELGLVIGKEGKNISEKNALSHIFGYTILNDISARDIQKKEMAVRLGPAKGKDFCSIIGPVIVTADEFKGKEPNLVMTASVNGQEWSKGKSGDSHFSWAQMIAHASMEEWVLPGDLFGSGTVGTGCGLELDKWIQPGDDLELTVEKIGTLKNKVGQPNS